MLWGVGPINIKDALEVKEKDAIPGVKFNIQEIEPLILGGVVVLIMAAALALFICIVWSSFQWLTSGGDKSVIQEARSRLSNCIVGLVIMSLAWAVILFIQYFFGLDGLFESTTK